MKKIFYCLCAASAMLFTACSDEAVNAPVEGESLVTITTQLPADLGTRTFGDGMTATNLTYAVYEKDSQTPLIVSKDQVTFSGLTATVNLRLANGKSYDLVFWADAAGSPYTFNARTQTVSINYDGVTSNLEKLDAFFANEKSLQVNGTINKTIKLKRPFAQLNIGATDYAAAETAAFKTASSAVKVNHVANALNIRTGEATGNETITFADAAVPADTERFPVDGVNADYLAMNYLLVDDTKQLVDVEFTATSTQAETITRSYANVPVQRNYRTNIYGNILTEDANFNIEIVPGFETPDYDIVISSESDLRNAAAQGGNAVLANDVTMTNFLIVTAAEPLNLNLNGHKLSTTPENAVYVRTGGKLNLSNGKFSSATQGEAYSSIVVEGNGEMDVDNVELKSDGSLFLMGDYGKLTIKNSSLKAQAWCVATNASTPTQNPTILLENCTFESETPVMVNVPSSLTLDGCTLNGRWQGLMVRGGTAVIKNSHINVNYAAADAATMATKYASRNWGSGNNVPVAAATFGNRTTNAYQYATNVTVENSDFNVQGDNASLFPAIYIYANSGDGIGVTLTYDANTTFNGGSKNIAVGSTNVKINGTAATVTE